MQIRKNIRQTLLMVSGLLALTFAAGLLFGRSGELVTRSLLTVYVAVAAAWVIFFTRLVRDQGYGIASVLAGCMLAAGYGLAAYAIWFHPAFYAQHWRWMNMLFLANLLFAPLLALIARFIKRA